MTPSGAIFSSCRKYRYVLWRYWGPGQRILVACCLNCSTADETKNDPTVAGMIARAKAWGYDGFVMVNLFAYRSTDPKALRLVDDPVGPGNDIAILEWAQKAATFICAWGSASPLIPARATTVVLKLQEAGIKLHYLKLSARTGEPWHPLYIEHARKPVEWNPF